MKKYWNAFNLIPGVGSKNFKKIYLGFKNLQKAWYSQEKEFLKLGLKDKLVKQIIKYREYINPDFEYKKIKQKNIKIATFFCENYPKLLKKIPDPPALLYYYGELPKENLFCLAVVGSRKYSAYGKRAAELLTRELCLNGINIISGLALGLDGIAHNAANQNHCSNFAVLPGGLDNITPRNNFKLSEDILKNGGGLISEYPLGFFTHPANFHQRNRIISGLSHGVLIIEAKEKSGTMITANHALNQGREVFCVPGDIFSPYSTGSNKLIKQGAKLTASIDDILEEFQIYKVSEKKKNKIHLKLSKIENKIFNNISLRGSNIDQILKKTQIDINHILINLTSLEMKGAVKKEADVYYRDQ